MKKFRVCYVLPPIEYFSPVSGGAIATIAANQARELEKMGHEVTILAPSTSDPQYDIGKVIALKIGTRSNLNVIQRGFSSKVVRPLHGYDWLYYEHYLKALQQAVRRISTPDVIIVSNDLQTPRHLRTWLPNSKIALTLHNQVRTRHRQPKLLFEACDIVLTVSNFIRDWTAQTYHLPASKIVTLYNGVDTEAFRPADNFLESAFLRDEGPLRVLYAGRIDPNKGCDLVPEAVRVLQEEGLSVQLSFAGATWFHGFDNQDRDPYVQKLHDLFRRVNAEYLGHVSHDKIPDVFRSCDVSCAPSRFPEPFGLVALEAMASGCALITARRGGIPEFCEDAAILIDPDEPEQFTNALRLFATEREVLRSYKRKSVARASEYSWDKIVAQLESHLA